MASQNLQDFLQSWVFTAYTYIPQMEMTPTHIRCLVYGLLNSCRITASKVKLPVAILQKVSLLNLKVFCYCFRPVKET